MEIRFACPATGSELVVTQDWAGRAFACPHCGDLHQVPQESATIEPEPPAPPPAPAQREIICPACRAEMSVEPGASRAACPTCSARFELHYVRPVRAVSAAASAKKCVNHEANWAVHHCRGCRRPICDLCTFGGLGGRYCPDCINDASLHEVPGTMGKAVASVALAGLSVVLFVLLFVLAAQSTPKEAETVGMVFGTLIMASAAGGLYFGFAGREGGSSTSASLGMLGLVLNGLFFLIFVLLVVAGNLMR